MQEISPFQLSIMVQGTEVGKLARKLFPNGILIGEDYKNLSKAITHTKEVLKTSPDAIFEGAFVYENILIRVDILKDNHDGSFDLIEVKSSTSVKKEHFPDCAVQAYVLEKLGFKLNHVCIMYLNNKYVRHGALDLSQLFITEPIENNLHKELNNVPIYLRAINDTLNKDEEPFWHIGSICNSTYVCEFKNHCWGNVSEKAIHFISRISEKQRLALVEMGIELVKDVPEDFKLSELQKIQVDCEKNQTVFVDNDSIKVHLSELQFPLYFLDFETYGYAVPEYDGTRPYQHLPFQFSLHVKRAPNADLEHYDFLYTEKENPSRTLAEKLVQHIGPAGSVIVYYESSEGGGR